MASLWCRSSSHCFISCHHRSPAPSASFPKRKSLVTVASARGVADIATVLQNKVLVSAAVASAVGQLAKPLSKVLKGEGVDLRAAVRSGGMPSVHSAVGSCCSLNLLGPGKGFFRFNFWLFCCHCINNYGVRREVGNHARLLNSLMEIYSSQLSVKKEDLTDSRMENIKTENLFPLLSTSDNIRSSTTAEEPFVSPVSQQIVTRTDPTLPIAMVGNGWPDHADDSSHDTVKLNESVGHTEIQVLAGAFLGFLVALTIETIL